VATQKKEYTNRVRASFPKGTRIYGWRFNHPKFGWCGGNNSDDWSENRAVIQRIMLHCEWDSELIEVVA